MAILFKASKQLEYEIDEFLDAISEGVIVFKQGVKYYLADKKESFLEQIKTIDELEFKADNLRHKIENELYTHSLIPEHRGDVLGLLETLDDVIDKAKETLSQFDVETPDIPTSLSDMYYELAETIVESCESMTKASRAFFKDVKAVKDHLHKVYFYEKEADKLADKLKRKIFSLDIHLSHKMHLRYFATHIDGIADRAEDVAQRLGIYTIKRSL
jgi:uncharacterized protein